MMVYENDIVKHRQKQAKLSPEIRSCGYCGGPTTHLVGKCPVCPACARDMINVSMCYNPTTATGAEYAREGGDAMG